MPVWIKVLKEDKDLPLPEFKYEGDAGFDLMSAENVTVFPNMPLPTKISTGMRFSIPIGYEMQIRSRSGMVSKYNVCVANAPATIDATFSGIVSVLLVNNSQDPFHIKKGDRIAQGIINKLPEILFEETNNIKETKRGDNGFGSTGVQ